MIRKILLLTTAVLINGCAVKTPSFDPEVDSLRTYAKRLIESNRYHVNGSVNYNESQRSDTVTFIVPITSHMGGATLYNAMIDACDAQGGTAEEILNDVYEVPRPASPVAQSHAFICRTPGKGAALFKVMHVLPYKLGFQYSVIMSESSSFERSFKDLL